MLSTGVEYGLCGLSTLKLHAVASNLEPLLVHGMMSKDLESLKPLAH